MKKLLPIGFHDYKEIVENDYYYIDKTLLIKEVWESGKVVLMPRPRRFGKTLNLSMIHYFFKISDESHESLFVGKAIWQHAAFRGLLGTFPVIFLTFRSVVFTAFADTCEMVATVIASEFDSHAYLLASDALETYEKVIFDRIRQKTASHVELAQSIEYLMKFLHKHHKKKVIVLIDEYDVPVQSAFVHGFYNEMIDFLRPLLTSAFKDNSILEKGVITGILTLSKAGIFSGLNNLEVFNILRPEMSDKFGFTTAEAEALMHDYDIENADTVQEWYNGYVFGTMQGMFNPWSLLNCARSHGSLELYWANTSDNVLIKRLITKASLSLKTELESLLTDGTIEKTIEETTIFPDLDNQPDLVWSLLLFTGYLTSTHFTMKEGKKICTLRIPNQEVKYLFNDLIRKIFTESVRGEKAEELLYALTHGDTSTFEQLLQNFVMTSMSVFDLPDNEPEKSYHLFVLGLLVMLNDTYEVKSNRESGFGRYDILILPRDTSKPALMIEFKKVTPKEDLEQAAQKALDQIIQKNYTQEISQRHIQKTIAYGIAFSGKALRILSTILA